MGTTLEKQVYYTVFINKDIHNVTGRKRSKKGYQVICIKTHPNSDGQGCIFEHRVIMEMFIGRYLTKDEIIHHKNGIKHDNRLSNLEITTNAEHTRLHHTGLKRNDETKKKQSDWAKERLSKKTNHPSYRDVDKELTNLYLEGHTPTSISRKLGVTRKTVYNKIGYLNLKEEKL